MKENIKDPNMKTMVVHSQSKSAWNVVSVRTGDKYKIARVPYLVINDEKIDSINRGQAFEHAKFISYCFNHSDEICNGSKQ